MNSNADFQIKTSYDLVALIDISEDTDDSVPVDLGGGVLTGVFLPSNFDGTGFSLYACDTLDGTYSVVTAADGTPYAVASVAAGEYVALNTEITKGIRFLKIKTASAQTTTDTLIKLATRSL